MLEARSDLGSHNGPGTLVSSSGWSVERTLHASRKFLMLLCHLPDPLLRIPGGEDTENGEKLKVGGDKPRRDSWD